MAEDESYVTRSAWVRTLGRPDAIDEIADEFEHRAPSPGAGTVPAWPQRSRGWAEDNRLHPERRAS